MFRAGFVMINFWDKLLVRNMSKKLLHPPNRCVNLRQRNRIVLKMFQKNLTSILKLCLKAHLYLWPHTNLKAEYVAFHTCLLRSSCWKPKAVCVALNELYD